MVWTFLTRAGGERDLLDELAERLGPRVATVLAPGIVQTPERPRLRDGTLAPLTFARQAMRQYETVPPLTAAVAGMVADTLATHRPKSGSPGWTWTLQVLAPDSADPKDPRRPIAKALEDGIAEALEGRLPPGLAERRVDAQEAQRLAQVWIAKPDLALIGFTVAAQAMSRWPGGRVRLRRAEDDPSRSALKLEEAIEWVGVGPESGDLCIDLGAAPGGWTQVALRRGAAVIAIDPGTMKVQAPAKKYTHLRENAFTFVPPETVDWLLCDMAYRPREVAQMLAKWGRRAWARQLIANIKLPMKQKAKMVTEVFGLLSAAGWQGLRARQLYHDREEVTLFGWLDPSKAQRGPQAPFRPRTGRPQTGRPQTGRPQTGRPQTGRPRSPRGRDQPRTGARGRSTGRGDRGGRRGARGQNGGGRRS